MEGCHEKINAVTIYEVECPKCKDTIEAYYKDGHHAVDAKCESCGYTIEAGSPFEK